MMEYWDGVNWVSVIDENEAATTPEAVAGISSFKYSSPATAIAKSSPGTTGAAVLPAGTTFDRPGPAAGVSAGWTRFNFDYQRLEYFDGANWVLISPYLQALDDISGLFDGIIDTFELKINGVPFFPSPQYNFVVFLGGVGQIPGSAYTVTLGRYITFASAPPIGTTCYMFTVALTPG
jgi:hypothetical protein